MGNFIWTAYFNPSFYSLFIVPWHWWTWHQGPWYLFCFFPIFFFGMKCLSTQLVIGVCWSCRVVLFSDWSYWSQPLLSSFLSCSLHPSLRITCILWVCMPLYKTYFFFLLVSLKCCPLEESKIPDKRPCMPEGSLPSGTGVPLVFALVDTASCTFESDCCCWACGAKGVYLAL